MECPRCGKQSDTLWGNGTYPNSSYRCNICDGAEWCKVVVIMTVIIALIIIGWFILEVKP